MSPVSPIPGRGLLAKSATEVVEVDKRFVVGGETYFTISSPGGEKMQHEVFARRQLKHSPINAEPGTGRFDLKPELLPYGCPDILAALFQQAAK